MAGALFCAAGAETQERHIKSSTRVTVSVSKDFAVGSALKKNYGDSVHSASVDVFIQKRPPERQNTAL